MGVEFDTNEIEREIVKQVRTSVAQLSQKVANALVPVVPSLLDVAIHKSPEYESLISGKLREEFGLANPGSMVDSIIQAVKGGIGIELLGSEGADFMGGILIGVYQEKFADAMSASGASYISLGKKRGAKLIPWLQWLLFAGDDIVIIDAEILYDYPTRKVSFRSASRTGKAIMVTRQYSPTDSKASRYNRSLKHSHGITRQPGWRVPPEFAGTEENNFLTKAAMSMVPELEKKITDLFMDGQ